MLARWEGGAWRRGQEVHLLCLTWQTEERAFVKRGSAYTAHGASRK